MGYCGSLSRPVRLPTQDQGYLLVNVQLPNSASVQRTEEVMANIDKIARGDPNDREHYPGIPGVAHTVGVGRVIHATPLTSRQRQILNQLSLPTPAQTLRRILHPVPTG
jgi:multidrug efflux pump subunit AcrB